MSKYIENLIKQGENQQLDFKFEINDSKKIARTIVAFANTDGGKLLIGIKDNGSVTGIRSEEEYHMVEAASQMYCKPPIQFEGKEWKINNKTILEITILKGKTRPYLAPDKDNKWKAWIRINDENILANEILIKAWKKQNSKLGVLIKYSEKEEILLNYLQTNSYISLSKYCKIAKVNRPKAKNIIANLLSIQVIEAIYKENNFFYKLLRTK